MEINIKQIWEGWRNDLFPKEELKELIERTAQERLLICQECEYNSNLAKELHEYTTIRPDYHCTKCGCPLKQKTKCLSCKCPADKWEAVITEEKEQLIENELGDEKE